MSLSVVFLKNSQCTCIHCIPGGPPGYRGAQGDFLSQNIHEVTLKPTMTITLKGKKVNHGKVCHVGDGYSREKGLVFLVSYGEKHNRDAIACAMCLLWS